MMRTNSGLNRWFKVKLKLTDSSGAIGLVPASYLTKPTSLRIVTATFAYSPALNEHGQLQNEEELRIMEGEQFNLFEEEGDWVLVGRTDGKGVGFVPATYVSVSHLFCSSS